MTVLPVILCIGDLDVDFFIAVPSVPGFDQKMTGRNVGQKPGGMSANSAVAVARLGHPARLLAAVGGDAAGDMALGQMGVEGVDTRFVAVRGGVSTFMCVVLVSPSAEKSLIRLPTNAYLPDPGDVVPAAFEDVAHVHATYGAPEVTAKAFELAVERGISASLDLEPPDIRAAPQRLAKILPFVDTLFLNEEAASAASNVLGIALHPGLLKPGGEIIITLGGRGCRRIAAEGLLEIPGFKVRPVDTTGAGDCFAAAYLVRKLEGTGAAAGLEFANAAAALATLDYGAQTAMPRREAVEEFMARSGRGGAAQTDAAGRINA